MWILKGATIISVALIRGNAVPQFPREEIVIGGVL